MVQFNLKKQNYNVAIHSSVFKIIRTFISMLIFKMLYSLPPFSNVRQPII